MIHLHVVYRTAGYYHYITHLVKLEQCFLIVTMMSWQLKSWMVLQL